MSSKSIMGKIVIKLNKLSIFEETDLLHDPSGNQSHPHAHKAPRFMGNSPWFLMGFDFHTLIPLVAEESFLLTLSAAAVQYYLD
jgi:hypothetical protein